MKRTLMAAAAILALAAGAASAQPYGHDNGHRGDQNDRVAQDNRGHDNDHRGASDDHRYQDNRGHYIHHAEWQRGHRMHQDDWSRGERVDWRAHHLRHPPRGYEWRQVDGNYVMAAAATGLIASIIANSH